MVTRGFDKFFLLGWFDSAGTTTDNVCFFNRVYKVMFLLFVVIFFHTLSVTQLYRDLMYDIVFSCVCASTLSGDSIGAF